MEPASSDNIFKKAIKSEISHHVFFWFFLFFIMTIGTPFTLSKLKDHLIFLVKLSIPVYIHFYIFDKYFNKKKFIIYILLLILLIISFSAADHALFPTSKPKESSLNSRILMTSLFIFISTMFRLGGKGIRQELLYREIKAKQTQTELGLLKAQINPHFLFNTLNNLFSMARKYRDEKTAQGISKLAHIMRYMIYDTDVNKIALSKEMDQIKNLIELQKLRFSTDDDINININVEGEIENVKIAPMILIPFVENAFKYSISLQNPTVIEINLKIADENLFFNVKNTINRQKQGKDENSSGIGLANIRRRLKLLYPDSHELNIAEDENLFFVSLTIDLEKSEL